MLPFPVAYANLHLHSSCSDSTFRPMHLPRIAKSVGYGAVALTDHETLCGLPEFMAEAEACGLEAITGIEIFAKLDGVSKPIHLIGLDFDPNHPAITGFVQKLIRARNENTRAKFEIAVEKGIFKGITWDDVVRCNPQTDWYYVTQVYFALDAMGIIPLYRRYETNDAAFNSPEAQAVELTVFPMEEVIAAIRQAGGIAVLAHPGESIFPRVREMVDMGLNGIEISHPSITEAASKFAIHAATEYGLYCSGGTDHTGALSSLPGRYAVPAFQGISRQDFGIIKKRSLD
ncbi:MAG: PHP domain-containing protein [Oscillospiraceae bacterium]|nr:PHP domain-containing protein [Oscillospiraceae bacterium]